MGRISARVILWLASLFLVACAMQPVNSQANCDVSQVADSFYTANDQQDVDSSLSLLTDDIALVTWADGANGNHVSPDFAVGKNQLRGWLNQPGLRRTAVNPDRPNFKEANRQVSDNSVQFDLMPDRARSDGKQFNHYSVELVFHGCKIEIIKLVERVTWL